MREAWTVTTAAARRRLDVVVSERLAMTRSQAAKLFDQRLVTVNGRVVKPSCIVEEGDKIMAETADSQPASPEPLSLPVVYEDADILVIDKPAGLNSQPIPGHSETASVADFTRPRVNDPQSPDRPGLVHRLDRNTSGLMIVAKHPEAKRFLQQQFKNHAVTKTYTALVVGHLKLPEAEIRLPVGRSGSGPLHQTVKLGGREAVTRYRAEREFGDSTLVLAWPQTGRTHQLRVHFRHLGHPIVGDQRYGAPPTPGLNRHFLHASSLQFTGPNGQRLELSSLLPLELQHWLERRV